MIDELERQFEDHLRETDRALRATPIPPFGVVRRAHGRRAVALASALTVAVVGVPVLFGILAGDGPTADNPEPLPVVATVTTQGVHEVLDGPWSWRQLESAALGGEGSQVISTIEHTRHGLLAGGYSGSEAALWRSDDGLTWERMPDPEGAFGAPSGVFGTEGRLIINGVADLGIRTVAVGVECGSGVRELDGCVAAAWYSDDGVAWHRADHQVDLELAESVFFRDVEWESWHADVPTAGMTGVVSTPLGLVAVGDGIWTSSDGIDWDLQEMVGTALFDVMVVGEDLLLLGTDKSQAGAWWSQYGRLWRSARVEASSDVEAGTASTRLVGAVAFDDGFTAVGLHDADYGFDVAFWSSEDGDVWSLSRIGTWGMMENLFGIAGAGDTVVAVGTEAHTGQRAAVWMSADRGLTWTKVANDAALFGHYDLESHASAAYAAVEADGRLIVGGHRDGDAAVWVAERAP
ncbi:MAG: hypothetical protein ACN4GK_11825 [Acidimicrobiia bacterium]